MNDISAEILCKSRKTLPQILMKWPEWWIFHMYSIEIVSESGLVSFGDVWTLESTRWKLFPNRKSERVNDLAYRDLKPGNISKFVSEDGKAIHINWPIMMLHVNGKIFNQFNRPVVLNNYTFPLDCVTIFHMRAKNKFRMWRNDKRCMWMTFSLENPM